MADAPIGNMTVNTPAWFAGQALSPVIHSHTVHTLAASESKISNNQLDWALWKSQSAYGPKTKGVISRKPHRLMSAVMRLTASTPLSCLPIQV